MKSRDQNRQGLNTVLLLLQSLNHWTKTKTRFLPNMVRGKRLGLPLCPSHQRLGCIATSVQSDLTTIFLSFFVLCLPFLLPSPALTQPPPHRTINSPQVSRSTTRNTVHKFANSVLLPCRCLPRPKLKKLRKSPPI